MAIKYWDKEFDNGDGTFGKWKYLSTTGKSAYQQAKEGGYTGTENEFNTLLASLDQRLGKVDIQFLTSGVDLNDYVELGFYIAGNSTLAASISNRASNYAFCLAVYPTAGAVAGSMQACTQVVYEYYRQSGVFPKVYKRGYYANANPKWTAWKEEIIEETDPIFDAWKNGSVIAAGQNVIVDSGSSYGIAIGAQAEIAGNEAIAIGHTAYARQGSISIGQNITHSGGSVSNAVAIGNNTVSGPNSVAIGTNAATSTTNSIGAISIGVNSNTSANNTIAIGSGAIANAAGTISIGNGASLPTGSTSSIAIGSSAQITGSTSINSIVIGNGAKSTAAETISIGSNNAVNAIGSSAIGYGNTTNSVGSVNIGYTNTVSGESSVTIGRESRSTTIGSFAGGYQAWATGNYSIALGPIARVSTENSIVIGRQSTISSGTQSIAIGYNSSNTGGSNISLGAFANTGGLGSITVGNNAKTTENYSISIGSTSSADGLQSISIGYNTNTNVPYGVSLGAGSALITSDIDVLDGTYRPISIGNTTNDITRRIINLKAGINGTDAVNKAQMEQAISESSSTVDLTNNLGTSQTTAMSQYGVTNALFATPGNYNQISIGNSNTFSNTTSAITIAPGGNGSTITNTDGSIVLLRSGNGASFINVNGINNILIGTIGNGVLNNSIQTNGDFNIMIGEDIEMAGGVSRNVLIGREAISGAEDSITLGFASMSEDTDIVATDELGIVSVGSTRGNSAAGIGPFTRRIINVSDGINDTDVVTLKQVNNLITTIGRPVFIAGSGVATAIGTNAFAAGQATASGNGSVSIGHTSAAPSPGGIAIGYESNSTGAATVALGQSAKTTQERAVAVGYNTSSTGVGSIAIGWDSVASNQGGTGLGRLSKSQNNYATALGYNSTASGISSIAIGASAGATGQNSATLGSGTSNNVANAVVLGASSQALASMTDVSDTNGFVSVGSQTVKRRILNVANGINDNDVATVGQLNNKLGDAENLFTLAPVSGFATGLWSYLGKDSSGNGYFKQMTTINSEAGYLYKVSNGVITQINNTFNFNWIKVVTGVNNILYAICDDAASAKIYSIVGNTVSAVTNSAQGSSIWIFNLLGNTYVQTQWNSTGYEILRLNTSTGAFDIIASDTGQSLGSSTAMAALGIYDNKYYFARQNELSIAYFDGTSVVATTIPYGTDFTNFVMNNGTDILLYQNDDTTLYKITGSNTAVQVTTPSVDQYVGTLNKYDYCPYLSGFINGNIYQFNNLSNSLDIILETEYTAYGFDPLDNNKYYVTLFKADGNDDIIGLSIFNKDTLSLTAASNSLRALYDTYIDQNGNSFGAIYAVLSSASTESGIYSINDGSQYIYGRKGRAWVPINAEYITAIMTGTFSTMSTEQTSNNMLDIKNKLLNVRSNI